MVVMDQPFREWRGLQLDIHGNPYHSIESLKATIRLARYYKHNVLTLNTGPAAWLSPIMNSTTLMNSSWRSGDWTGYFGVNPCYLSNCVMYSATEISELIKYGAARGVRMIPFTSAIPRGEFPATLNSSMVPPGVGYKHADWMDEVDGLGPSTWTGSLEPGPQTDRFWNFMNVAVERVYKLFAQGWPGGVVPSWHLGAVLGEGGMPTAMARRMYELVQNVARAAHGPSTPAVTVGFYSGPAYDDPNLADIAHNLINHWYNTEGANGGVGKFLNAGWNIVSLTWAPLYICPGCFNGNNEFGPYMPEQVFENFNYFWVNKEQQAAMNPVRGQPMIVNESLMAQYWVPGREAQTQGAIMSTWEIGITCKHCNEMSYVRERAGPFAEHAWNYGPYPYPTTGPHSWGAFQPRQAAADAQLDMLIGKIARDWSCAVNPHDGNKTTCQYTNGTGTHYLANCGGTMESAPPWNAVCSPSTTTR